MCHKRDTAGLHLKLPLGNEERNDNQNGKSKDNEGGGKDDGEERRQNVRTWVLGIMRLKTSLRSEVKYLWDEFIYYYEIF